ADDVSVYTLMLAVVTAEAPHRIEVGIVRGICIPPDFHRREEIVVISVLQVRDNAFDRLLLGFVYLRVSLLIITTQGAVDSPNCLLPVGISRCKCRYTLLLDEWKRGIDTVI